MVGAPLRFPSFVEGSCSDFDDHPNTTLSHATQILPPHYCQPQYILLDYNLNIWHTSVSTAPFSELRLTRLHTYVLLSGTLRPLRSHGNWQDDTSRA